MAAGGIFSWGGANVQILGVAKFNLGPTPQRLLLHNLTSCRQKALIRLMLLRNKDISIFQVSCSLENS